MQNIDLKKFRDENSIGQSELKKLFNCSQPFISRLENGKEKITNIHMNILINKYGKDLIEKYAFYEPIKENEILNEPKAEYITISREILDILKIQSETILSQQRTIENINKLLTDKN